MMRRALWRLSSGGAIGNPLIHKFVKPIKVARFRPTDQVRFNQLLVTKAEPQIRAAHTAVLREADTAVGGEKSRFKLMDGRLNQTAEFTALFLRDRGFQVLDLGRLLPDEHDKGDIRYATDPGIANELWIEGEKPLRLFRIPAGRCFPVDQAALAIEFTDRVDIGNKIIASIDGRMSLSCRFSLGRGTQTRSSRTNFSSK